MLLTSSAYFFFLIAVFLLYWPLSRFRVAGLALILFANYFFYAKWDLFYLALIPIASTIDFALGGMIFRSSNIDRRKTLVSLSVLLNLGMLATFKYMPFFLENLAGMVGAEAPKWTWTFSLGISFYAFQSLTYTIDIYRKDAKPTSSLLTYLAAVSFFPTTLAGPITRVSTLIPQLEKTTRMLDAAEGGRALFLIGLGLMKKMLIADYLAENLVNRVFDFPNLYSGSEVLIGVYAYAVQLYYDFSGYSDVAIGSALLLGVKLPQNFNAPYAAANIADFWRRWHISLSNWLRDYLFFSLPGQRTTIWPYINLVLTMAIGGFWHGPSWNFLVWGLLHGVALAVVRFLDVRRGKAPHKLPPLVTTFFTVQYVCFAWIFFRASTFQGSWKILRRIASLSVSFDNVSAGLWIVLSIGILGHYVKKEWFEFSQTSFERIPFYGQAAALMLLAIAIQYVAATGAAPFIYTKF